LRNEGFEVIGLYFNPNIYPLSEYKLRLATVRQYAPTQNFMLWEEEYDPGVFFRALDSTAKGKRRCESCWRLRLQHTAVKAKGQGLEYFSTTLLVSPYQDQDMIRALGNETAQEAQIGFLGEDYRPGFRAAQEEAKALGMYRQKYCGCIFSHGECRQ
jgi:predicted adenine nucleotide alpha hydrolase (AANH) superfamily ATPase